MCFILPAQYLQEDHTNIGGNGQETINRFGHFNDFTCEIVKYPERTFQGQTV